MRVIELKRINRVKPASAHLKNRHASNATCQFGENGIISKILELIESTNRWCVEFGARDGMYLSGI